MLYHVCAFATPVVTVGDTCASWGHLRQQSCDNFILKLGLFLRLFYVDMACFVFTM